MLYNAALVLEGGAMRGQYSTGITDAFLAHHIEFKSVIGVSAGALCGAQYVSNTFLNSMGGWFMLIRTTVKIRNIFLCCTC